MPPPRGQTVLLSIFGNSTLKTWIGISNLDLIEFFSQTNWTTTVFLGQGFKNIAPVIFCRTKDPVFFDIAKMIFGLKTILVARECAERGWFTKYKNLVYSGSWFFNTKLRNLNAFLSITWLLIIQKRSSWIQKMPFKNLYPNLKSVFSMKNYQLSKKNF